MGNAVACPAEEVQYVCAVGLPYERRSRLQPAASHTEGLHPFSGPFIGVSDPREDRGTRCSRFVVGHPGHVPTVRMTLHVGVGPSGRVKVSE